MLPQDVSNSIVIGYKKSDLAEDKDFKTPIINMFKYLKEDPNKCQKDHKNLPKKKTHTSKNNSRHESRI